MVYPPADAEGIGTRRDDHPCKSEGPAPRLPLSLRGAKRRGNPFSFRPRRGRAVLRTAGDADCHVGLCPPRNDSGRWGLIPLPSVRQLWRHCGRFLHRPYGVAGYMVPSSSSSRRQSSCWRLSRRAARSAISPSRLRSVSSPKYLRSRRKQAVRSPAVPGLGFAAV